MTLRIGLDDVLEAAEAVEPVAGALDAGALLGGQVEHLDGAGAGEGEPGSASRGAGILTARAVHWPLQDVPAHANPAPTRNSAAKPAPSSAPPSSWSSAHCPTSSPCRALVDGLPAPVGDHRDEVRALLPQRRPQPTHGVRAGLGGLRRAEVRRVFRVHRVMPDEVPAGVGGADEVEAGEGLSA